MPGTQANVETGHEGRVVLVRQAEHHDMTRLQINKQSCILRMFLLLNLQHFSDILFSARLLVCFPQDLHQKGSSTLFILPWFSLIFFFLLIIYILISILLILFLFCFLS